MKSIKDIRLSKYYFSYTTKSAYKSNNTVRAKISYLELLYIRNIIY